MKDLWLPIIIVGFGALVVLFFFWFMWKLTRSEEVLPENTEKYFTKQDHERKLPNHNMDGSNNKRG
jgi:hypothetical protein